MDNVLARVSPKALKSYKKASFIKSLKIYKDHQVCQQIVGYHCTKNSLCTECRALSAMMCRRYHNCSYVDELAQRLAYEVIFDMIPISAIEDGSWLDSRFRDSGHTTRMRIIWHRSGGSASKHYPWITYPRM